MTPPRRPDPAAEFAARVDKAVYTDATDDGLVLGHYVKIAAVFTDSRRAAYVARKMGLPVHKLKVGRDRTPRLYLTPLGAVKLWHRLTGREYPAANPPPLKETA